MQKAFLAFVSVSVGLCLVSCGGEPAPDQGLQTVVTSGENAVTGNIPIEDIDVYAEAPLLKIGYVNQDHHTAVFVAALRHEMMHRLYPVYLVPLGEDFYALVKNNEKIAEIEYIQSQGAINVPNNMQAGLFDIGFGGVAAFASSIDQGNSISIVAPLHQRGDMLVVGADNQAVSDWETFLEWVDGPDGPVTVGFKSPQSVALIIFQSALTEAGVGYAMAGGNVENTRVILYNAQGEPNLNVALEEGLIDAYVSNNPSCAMAEYNGIGKCVAELSMLPPGDFENHPCCAIAATHGVVAGNPAEVAAVLELFVYATDFINENPADAAAAASEWIGTPVDVEMASMATSLYDMHVTDDWTGNMGLILDHMRNLNSFTGPLAEPENQSAIELLTDFSLLPEDCRQ